jgi:hypothetical protein
LWIDPFGRFECRDRRGQGNSIDAQLPFRQPSGHCNLTADTGEFMRLIGATSILVLFCAMPALAAELPSRKPGLWQVKTSIGGSNVPAPVIKQCIDATTDQMMQSSAGPSAPAACPERDVQRSENSITIDSTCVWKACDRTLGHYRQLRQRLYDDGDIATPGYSRREDNHDDGCQMARCLRGGPEAW